MTNYTDDIGSTYILVNSQYQRENILYGEVKNMENSKPSVLPSRVWRSKLTDGVLYRFP